MAETNLTSQRSNLWIGGQNSLAHLFRSMRIFRNETKEVLAQKFDVTEAYLSAIESGRRAPSLKYWLLCAKEFDANALWVREKWINQTLSRTEERLRNKVLEERRKENYCES